MAPRRLTFKQAPPAVYLPAFDQQAIDGAALESEAWAEMTALGEDQQRQHVHYTRVKTGNAGGVQPHNFSRGEKSAGVPAAAQTS